MSFALIAGQGEAHFPELPGWAIGHATARAAAEFANWMQNGDPESTGERLSGLLAAARTALLWETLEADDPQLALTPEAIGACLGNLGRESVEQYRLWQTRGDRPRQETLRELSDFLRSHEAFRPRSLASAAQLAS